MTTLPVMVRLLRALALMACCAPCVALAQNSPGTSNGPAGDEMRVMRQMLEQQSKQLDVLAQEIARLNLLLEARTPTAAGLAPSPAEAPAPADNAGSNPPKAELAEEAPTPPAATHIVSKGETLTAIAKHYKVTVPELLKVNKIADVRKLQIGQTLVLPPGAKTQESPTPSPSPQQ